MISYRPLFKTMSEKNITSYALFKNGFSKATYYSIKKGDYSGKIAHALKRVQRMRAAV